MVGSDTCCDGERPELSNDSDLKTSLLLLGMAGFLQLMPQNHLSKCPKSSAIAAVFLESGIGC